MITFTSKREKRLWIWALVVLVTIYATLGLVRSLADALEASGIGGHLFSLGMLLVVAAIIAQGLRLRPGGAEIAVALGIMAVYTIVFARMTVPAERSHIIEYGILALIIHEALKERAKNGGRVSYPSLLAIVITTLFGLLDECIQYFLPNRVFDWFDVLFDFLASVMAVVGSETLAWARRWTLKKLQ